MSIKWYRVGEIGEALTDIVEAFLEGFTDDIEFAVELSRLGLSVEEQLDVLKEEIDRHEKLLLEVDGNGTIH